MPVTIASITISYTEQRFTYSPVIMGHRIILKQKRSTSVQRKHPWIFSGAIHGVEGHPEFGETVSVYSYDGEFLAQGHYSPHSQIRVRLISWDESDLCHQDAFWIEKMDRAIRARKIILADHKTTACRLIYAENDGLPGLIVDKYNDVLVMQCLSSGIEVRKQHLCRLLEDLLHPQAIYERSDADIRQKEGLSQQAGLLTGVLPQQPIEILENGVRFLVDITTGHKTGFYLDQRKNREYFGKLVNNLTCSNVKPRILNVFSYTGGFTTYGMLNGAASAVNIDASEQACRLGRQILAINQIPSTQVTDIVNDAFKSLRQLKKEGRNFDVIVLDPPKFASTQRDIRRASRGYKDINMQAMHLLAPGGYLITFSCSGAVSEELFQKIVFGAAMDAGRHIQIVSKLTQSDDHPIALTFPEGAYLKGLVCRFN